METQTIIFLIVQTLILLVLIMTLLLKVTNFKKSEKSKNDLIKELNDKILDNNRNMAEFLSNQNQLLNNMMKELNDKILDNNRNMAEFLSNQNQLLNNMMKDFNVEISENNKQIIEFFSNLNQFVQNMQSDQLSFSKNIISSTDEITKIVNDFREQTTINIHDLVNANKNAVEELNIFQKDHLEVLNNNYTRLLEETKALHKEAVSSLDSNISNHLTTIDSNYVKHLNDTKNLIKSKIEEYNEFIIDTLQNFENNSGKIFEDIKKHNIELNNTINKGLINIDSTLKETVKIE